MWTPAEIFLWLLKVLGFYKVLFQQKLPVKEPCTAVYELLMSSYPHEVLPDEAHPFPRRLTRKP